MSFPTLQVRPNEKNPKVLRAHEFLRQANQLVERNLLNADGKKLLAKQLSKMVNEVKGIYALDEKRIEAGKSAKLLDKLKVVHEVSMTVMEDRFVTADLARKVLEKNSDVQRKLTEIENLRNSVQVTKAEVQREKEKREKRRNFTRKSTDELAAKSSTILKHLENSADVVKLRKMEEAKRVLEEEVEGLRKEKNRLGEQIKTNKATLKVESRKSFQKTIIECAKHYKLCQTLTPKLLKSQKNVETLKEEEEIRRASGSLDETILFDRSFVAASMEKSKYPIIHQTPPPPNREPSHIDRPVFAKEIFQAAERTPEKAPVVAPVVPKSPVKLVPNEPRKLSSPPMRKSVEQSLPNVPKSPEIVKELPEKVVVEKEMEPEPEQDTMEVADDQLQNTINSFSENGENSMITDVTNEENMEPNGVEIETEIASKNVSMETQRVIPQEEPEEDEPMEEEVPEKEKSVDVIEEEEDQQHEEPMEVDQTAILGKVKSTDKADVSQIGTESSVETSREKIPEKSPNPVKAPPVRPEPRPVEHRPVEPIDEEENASNQGDNFSFNFFGNSTNKTGAGDENGSGSETNFDFTFCNMGGSGDDASNNGSAFDFLGGGGGGGDADAGNSDPFGFGTSMKGAGENNGGGGGDMSFNFNFDGDDGNSNGGSGGGGAGGEANGNSTFFNF